MEKENEEKPYKVETREELEINKDLQTGIGTKETTTLKPAEVSILDVNIKTVGAKGSHMLECFCSHPEKKDGIKISSVKWENKGKLEVTGLWLNKDEDGMLRKNSAIALFLQSNKADTAEGLVGKTINTVLDDKGYLAFKNY